MDKEPLIGYQTRREPLGSQGETLEQFYARELIVALAKVCDADRSRSHNSDTVDSNHNSS